jgi:hypothetical protein
MKPKNARPSAKALKASKAKPQKRKLPPDPDGLFARAAARAKKVIAFYEKMYPDPGRDCLVQNLIHDLMHLADRDPSLGDIDEEAVWAIRMYDDLVKESEWMVS